MELIFGKDNAEKLKEKYTVLELETVEKEHNGEIVSMDVFCLIPGNKVGMADLPQLEQWIKLHNDFINGYKTKQFDYCLQCIEHLRGQFGGEVDTFYDEIQRRITEQPALTK
jgi:hypothetical protein